MSKLVKHWMRHPEAGLLHVICIQSPAKWVITAVLLVLYAGMTAEMTSTVHTFIAV